MFLAPFIPLALALGTGGYLFFHYAQANLLDLLAVQSKHYATILDTYIQERINDLADIEIALDKSELNSQFLETILKHMRANHPEYLDLAVVDRDGQTLFYTGPNVFKGTHIEAGKWHEDALHRGFSVSGVMSGTMGIPHWILARRIAKHDDFYTLRISVDTAALTQIIVSMAKQRLEVLLTDANGEIISSSSNQILTNSQVLSDPLFRESLDKSIWAAHAQAAFSSRALQYGNWHLVVRQSVTTLPSLADPAVLFFAVSILGGGIIVFLTSLYLTSYVEKLLSQREEEREQLREQLYRAGRLAELGEMAAGFAHEINNPLQIIKSDQAYIEMLLQELHCKEKNDDKFLEDIQEIKTSVDQIKIQIDRCARITHSILSFGRASATDVQHIDLTKFIPEVLTMVEKKMQLHNIQLHLNMGNNKIIVHVDPGRLQQVLLNLLNNAIYAITETSDDHKGELIISCITESNKVRIAISDNGIGISPDLHQLIFTPFFTTKPAGTGTGLGLSLCHGIVESMNGMLSFTSTKGQGSTFFIELPVLNTPITL